ncbi:MAG: hypothetical protein ABSE84_00320 [Isosphaeraceae bacterium]|jgi:hypothetical protein
MTPAVDFTGRTIEAGHVVVYPVRRGSSMWLNKLNVTQVRDDSIAGYNTAGRLLTIRNLQNVVIVPKAETV